MTTAIAVSDVHRRYGRIVALNGLSLEVDQGEIFGLLGANGAGKTTLIKILIGALRTDEGVVRVLDLDPIKQKTALRGQIGYMPQQPALYDDLSARANVRFFGRARLNHSLEDRITDVLDFLKLGDRADDAVSGFSGGMKQRVSLACALVHQPKLLLLDEPSTGVDPKLRESLWAHFHELTAQGVTIVVSTHQMDEALHCDRVAIMRGGEILACDAPRDLLASSPATVTIQNGVDVQTLQMADYRHQLPQKLGIGDRISSIEVREQTLEDIVLNLIAEKQERHHA